MQYIHLKKEKGFAMVITLAFLVVISFSFIISNSETYANSLIASVNQNKWISEGNYQNNFICQNFGCIKNTINNVNVTSISCPDNDCYSVTVTTDYDGIEISETEIFQ
jgi:hypothetical protein